MLASWSSIIGSSLFFSISFVWDIVAICGGTKFYSTLRAELAEIGTVVACFVIFIILCDDKAISLCRIGPLVWPVAAGKPLAVETSLSYREEKGASRRRSLFDVSIAFITSASLSRIWSKRKLNSEGFFSFILRLDTESGAFVFSGLCMFCGVRL